MQSNVGLVYFQLEDMSRAGRLLSESHDPRERQIGLGSMDVLTSIQNIAAIFLRQEDHDNAKPYLKGAESILAYHADDAIAPPVLSASDIATRNVFTEEETPEKKLKQRERERKARRSVF